VEPHDGGDTQTALPLRRRLRSKALDTYEIYTVDHLGTPLRPGKVGCYGIQAGRALRKERYEEARSGRHARLYQSDRRTATAGCFSSMLERLLAWGCHFGAENPNMYWYMLSGRSRYRTGGTGTRTNLCRPRPLFSSFQCSFHKDIYGIQQLGFIGASPGCNVEGLRVRQPSGTARGYDALASY
jgi:hypothetical protein